MVTRQQHLPVTMFITVQDGYLMFAVYYTCLTLKLVRDVVHILLRKCTPFFSWRRIRLPSLVPPPHPRQAILPLQLVHGMRQWWRMYSRLRVFQGIAISLAHTEDMWARSLPLLVAGSPDPTPTDQVLVIAYFLNSAVRISIASGWNANPQLAKVSGREETRETGRDTVKRLPRCISIMQSVYSNAIHAL